LEINVETKKMTKTLSSQKAMVRAYGEAISTKLMRRITELSAATSLADTSHLPPQRLHQLTGKYDTYFAVDLTRNMRLVFRGLDMNNEITMIKTDIISILVREVVDYHGH